jgi:hypothetical protein
MTTSYSGHNLAPINDVNTPTTIIHATVDENLCFNKVEFDITKFNLKSVAIEIRQGNRTMLAKTPLTSLVLLNPDTGLWEMRLKDPINFAQGQELWLLAYVVTAGLSVVFSGLAATAYGVSIASTVRPGDGAVKGVAHADRTYPPPQTTASFVNLQMFVPRGNVLVGGHSRYDWPHYFTDFTIEPYGAMGMLPTAVITDGAAVPIGPQMYDPDHYWDWLAQVAGSRDQASGLIVDPGAGSIDIAYDYGKFPTNDVINVAMSNGDKLVLGPLPIIETIVAASATRIRVVGRNLDGLHFRPTDALIIGSDAGGVHANIATYNLTDADIVSRTSTEIVIDLVRVGVTLDNNSCIGVWMRATTGVSDTPRWLSILAPNGSYYVGINNVNPGAPAPPPPAHVPFLTAAIIRPLAGQGAGVGNVTGNYLDTLTAVTLNGNPVPFTQAPGPLGQDCTVTFPALPPGNYPMVFTNPDGDSVGAAAEYQNR